MNTFFILPVFDSSVPNKLNYKIEVKSPQRLNFPGGLWATAIPTNGFPSTQDGRYVVLIKIHGIANAQLMLGFTCTANFESKDSCYAGYNGMTGAVLDCSDGTRLPSTVNYLPKEVTEKAQEIVAIMIISNNGAKKELQFSVDGHDGAPIDCTRFFKNDHPIIFPCVSFGCSDQNVEYLPFDRVQSRTTLIKHLLDSNTPANQSFRIRQRQTLPNRLHRKRSHSAL